MIRLTHTPLALASVLVFAVTACSGESAIAPTLPVLDTTVSQARASLPIVDSYTLTFHDHNMVQVSSLVVRNEVILGAHVRDALGNPPAGGTVTFQYCSLKKLPPNDITRADEAPSSACADGSARWDNLLSLNVDASGNAYMNFGFVQIPRTIGFRFKYSAQRGGGFISGLSAPQDFTWVAGS